MDYPWNLLRGFWKRVQGLDLRLRRNMSCDNTRNANVTVGALEVERV